MVQRMSAIRRRKLIKLIALVLAAAAVVAAAVWAIRKPGEKAIRASSNAERVAFIRAQGLQVEPEPLAEENLLLPDPFPEVLREYNQLQKRQGFDLEKLAGKEVTMYTYRVTGLDTDAEVQTSIYVYKNKIVGGDVHSTAFDGFMKELVAAGN